MKNRHPADRVVEIGLALVLMFWSLSALGQSVNSDQIKKKTDGGIVGDSSKNLAVGIVRASSAPSSPVTGQLWCDTTLSPCTLKQYTGSTWVAPQVNAAITTQTDVTSFPGSPVDGQIFFSKAERMLWVYNSTTSLWYSIGTSVTTSGGNIQDVYSAAVITPPGAATVATSGTAGSLSAGTYSYKITFRNANGGETTGGTVSNTITSLVSKSTDLSSIPTGGTGTTQRNVYRTKVNQAASGPWYWVGNIADNSTTTYHDGLADASAVVLAPDINFSAPLPGAWTVFNPAGVLVGGCGGTGPSRATMACYAGANGYVTQGNGSKTTDTDVLRASLSVAAYTSGNYTLQYRIKQLSANGDTYLTITGPAIFSMRNGTLDNAQKNVVYVGHNSSPVVTMPFSSSNHPSLTLSERTTLGGVQGGASVIGNPYPQVDALPMWVRWVKVGGTALFYSSASGFAWSPHFVCTGTNNTNSACSENSSVFGTSSMDHVELPAMVSSTGSSQSNIGWIEIDSFTLTVNP